MTLLATSDYENGLREYEHRLFITNNQHSLHAKQVVSEQGLGYVLQFIRYVPVLRSHGISVSLCAPSKLHKLIQASGIDPDPLTPEQASQMKD